ncbi:MAG: hypothetical protein JST68_26435 [Bacteroidetes bacterium]|nr:hypothetical protein [Bacteroidota bacterium]
MNRTFSALPLIAGLLLTLTACKKDKNNNPATGRDPNTADPAMIDRFSSAAGHLQVRTSTNGLPAAGAPINFDQGPFITRGLTPAGKIVDYYNFDIQPQKPAPIYVLFKSGESTPVSGQHNIIDVIPGDANYNDFWQIYKVTVPSSYVANTITSYQEITAQGYTITKTNDLVNCPVVPKGSTAAKRFPATSDNSLTIGWYKDKVVYYFNFFEKALTVTPDGLVPVAPIYVTFNINPNQSSGGPASGFKTEQGSDQTHNVLSVLPSDAGYSPLWAVAVYDNSSFPSVKDLTTVKAAPLLVPNAGDVNCPVVSIQQ